MDIPFTSLSNLHIDHLEEEARNSRYLLPEVRKFVIENFENLKSEDIALLQNKNNKYTIAQEYRRHSDLHRISLWPPYVPQMHKIIDLTVPNGEHRIPIRIYYPVSYENPTAAIFFIHGGGFVTHSIATDDGPVRCLADYTKMIAIQIDYRLAPENPWPAARDDVLCVAKYFKMHGKEHGINNDKMVVMGETAGANLALCTMLKLRDEGIYDIFMTGVLVCGIYQPTFTTESWRRYGNGGFLVSNVSGKFVLDCYLANSSDYLNPEIWPLFTDCKGLPPLYLVMSSADPLRDDTFMLANKLQSIGQEYYLNEWVGALHTGILEWGKNKTITRYLECLGDYITGWIT